MNTPATSSICARALAAVTAQSTHPETRFFVVAGRRLAVQLEYGYWQALDEVCGRSATRVPDLVTKLALTRKKEEVAHELRSLVVRHYRNLASPPRP